MAREGGLQNFGEGWALRKGFAGPDHAIVRDVPVNSPNAAYYAKIDEAKARGGAASEVGKESNVESVQALLQTQEKIRDAQQRVLDGRKRETAELYSQVDAAKQVVRAEKDRAEDRMASFGKLNPMRQQAVMGILKAGGPKSMSQANLLDEAGFSDQTKKFWLNRAGAVDKGGVVKNTVEAGMHAAEKAEAHLSKQLAEAKAKELAMTKALSETLQKIVQNQGKLEGFGGQIDKDIAANHGAFKELTQALLKRDQALRDDFHKAIAQLAAGHFS